MRSASIELYWASVGQRLVRALGVIEPDILGNALTSFPRAPVVVEIHIFVLERTPKTLCKNVVESSALPIHTNLSTGSFQDRCQLRAGKLTTLVGVPDLWCRRCKRLLY